MGTPGFVADGSAAFAALCLGFATTACSFAFVTAPSKQRTPVEREADRPAASADSEPETSRYARPILAREETQCTESKAAPVVDTLFAVPLLSWGGIALIGSSSQNHGSSGDDWSALARAVGVVFVAIGGIYAGSAAYGYSATGECVERHARERHRQYD